MVFSGVSALPETIKGLQSFNHDCKLQTFMKALIALMMNPFNRTFYERLGWQS
jgi:hypothetical protein